MLAVKTTLKDRWRQVINEAGKIKSPYLFTLQEGVSPNQFLEIESEGIILVTPKSLIKSYPEKIRPKVLQLKDFIALMKSKY